jgi:hypothetical protein
MVTGTISRSLIEYPSNMAGKNGKKTAMLNTAHILRELLM